MGFEKQSIGGKCKDLSAQLRTMANNKSADGAFREQLNSYANGVRDQALQLKILSAVKLADHGSDVAPKVSMLCGCFFFVLCF